MNEPGAAILLNVHTRAPLRIDVVFQRDFQLMWPASIGTGYGQWQPEEHSIIFGADGKQFYVAKGAPQVILEMRNIFKDGF